MNLTAALALSLLTGAVAQDSRPQSRPAKAHKHEIEMDALSRATLDRWEKMEYHLGRAGVETISFTVKVVNEDPLGNLAATGKYTFNGKKGALKWDKAELGTMLAQRGWSVESFDRLFVGDSHRSTLSGAKLKAEEKDGVTIIRVEGETPMRWKTFCYDDRGVATQFSMMVDTQTGGDAGVVIQVRHEKIGGRFVRSGWTLAMDLPGMGAFAGTTKIVNKKVGRFHVYGRVEESFTIGGQPFGSRRLTFSEYKINGTITEKKASTTTSRPATGGSKKATSRPK